MGKIVKCHLKGKTSSKLANGLNYYDLKKKLTPGFALPWGYIHVYYHSSQTSYAPNFEKVGRAYCFYAPNFEKVGRAYCFRLVCLCVCLCVC